MKWSAPNKETPWSGKPSCFVITFGEIIARLTQPHKRRVRPPCSSNKSHRAGMRATILASSQMCTVRWLPSRCRPGDVPSTPCQPMCVRLEALSTIAVQNVRFLSTRASSCWCLHGVLVAKVVRWCLPILHRSRLTVSCSVSDCLPECGCNKGASYTAKWLTLAHPEATPGSCLRLCRNSQRSP